MMVSCVRAGRAEAPATMRFVVYGDTRTGNEMHRKIVALIIQQKPAFVLQTGDLVPFGGNPAFWATYDDIVAPLKKVAEIYPARGNHDLGGPEYERHVTCPFTSGNRLYYSFDRGNCHFVAIDSFSPWAAGTPQYIWLEKDLAAAQHHARHCFVFFHVPPYSVGAHGSSTLVQQTLVPLFRKYGVRTVFCGHDHIYYRTKRDGLTYVVTGGGGAPLYGIHKDQMEPGDVAESVNNIVVCDVRGDTLFVNALRSDGSSLDHFTVSAPK
jgi:3',5'-cyclic AMP phosphodiesterase CpdA